MAAPNLNAPTNIAGDRDCWAGTNVLTTRVTAGASETIIVMGITAANITTGTAAWASWLINNGTSDFNGAFEISVPPTATVQLLDKPLVMNPADLLKLQASASSVIQFVTSMLRVT